MAIIDSSIYINPRPLNRFNVFRWHQVSQTPVTGWLPCASFSDLCGQEYYAMPVADYDSLLFSINAVLTDEEAAYNWGIIQCCELLSGEIVSTITNYMNGEVWDGITVGDVLTQINIQVDEWMPDGMFNFCLFDGATGDIKYISNPFRNVTNEDYLCKTLCVEANGYNLGNWTPAGSYFPDAGIRFRIDGVLFDNQPVSSRTEYTRFAGTKRIQSAMVQDSSTLSLYWLDNLTHEGLAFILNFDRLAVSVSSDLGNSALNAIRQYHYKPDGEYQRENYDGYGLSNATIKLLNQDVIVKTGSC